MESQYDMGSKPSKKQVVNHPQYEALRQEHQRLSELLAEEVKFKADVKDRVGLIKKTAEIIIWTAMTILSLVFLFAASAVVVLLAEGW